jgi:hypothetical protein
LSGQWKPCVHDRRTIHRPAQLSQPSVLVSAEAEWRSEM